MSFDNSDFMHDFYECPKCGGVLKDFKAQSQTSQRCISCGFETGIIDRGGNLSLDEFEM